MSRFQYTHPQVWITVHHARTDDGRHVTHAAPRVSGRALKPEVVPGVQSPGRVGRGHGESVQQYRKVVLGGGGPDGLQVRMVQGRAVRGVNKNRHWPAGFPPPVDLRNGGLHVPGGAQYDPGQPVAKRPAVVLHPAVICFIERIFQSRVRLGGPDAEPARWQQQVYVHSLQVHVLDPLGGVVL